MSKFFLFLCILVPTVILAQPVEKGQFDEQLLVKAFNEQLHEYRSTVNLPVIQENRILTEAAAHHTEYMYRTTIVSHYQEMNLPNYTNLYAPKDRIRHFAGDVVDGNNRYAEICMGATIKKPETYQEIAAHILEDILQSDNTAIINNGEARYMGVSIRKKKNMYFLAMKVGMGYNNIIVFKEG